VRSLLLDTTPLRTSPAFARLWLGLAVANLGAQLTVVAVGLQVYALTGSTLAVGVLGICALVPLVVFGLYGGAISDRHDRRTVALVASVISWTVTLGLVAQALAGNRSVGVLYALVAVQSAAGAVNGPARGAIVPRLLEPQQMPAANALQTLGFNVALTGGPLLGAVLVAAVDYALAYGLDAVLFTVALLALWRLPPIPPESEVRSRSGFHAVVDGLRYLATQPNVRMTFLVDIAAMLSMPRVLFPAVGVMFLGGGAATTGALTAAIAAGGILASLLSGGLTRVRWQGRVIAWAITGWSLAVVAFGVILVVAGRTAPSRVVWPALLAAFLVLAIAGASDSVSSVFRNTILQTATPDAMRGRLQGIFLVVVAGGPRVGELFVGALSERVTEGWAAVVAGSLSAALMWLLVRRQRRFWRYDAHHPEP